MLKTMDNVAVFFGLLMLFIFIFSILGMNLFGCRFCDPSTGNCERKNFDSLLWALVTVFQVQSIILNILSISYSFNIQILTQEDWNIVLFYGMERTNHWAALYFILLMTFGNYVLFNLLVAILVEGFKCQNDLFVDCYSEDEDDYYTDNDSDEDEREQKTRVTQNGLERGSKRRKDEQIHLCKNCKIENNSSSSDQNQKPSSKKQVKKMSTDMRLHLQAAVEKHGFETRMFVECSECGESIDKGPSYIVAKEDIEHGKDFEKFRTYRKLKHEESTAYRRPSKMSINEPKKKEKKQFLSKVGKKLTNLDTRNFLEKLRDFYQTRHSYSLFIWPSKSKFRKQCQKISEEGWFDFIILVFIAGNCITLAMERPTIPPWSRERRLLDIFNHIFTIVFTLEMSMKAVGYCLFIGENSYFSNNWNRLDGSLVIVGVIDTLGISDF